MSRFSLSFVSLITVLALVLNPLSAVAAPQTRLVAAVPIAASATSVPDSGLIRTTVTLRQSTDRDRLLKLGVTILSKSAGRLTLLVDEEQMETLARLRFEPETSDDLGDLLLANASRQSWLGLALAPLVQQSLATKKRIQLDAASQAAALADLRLAVGKLSPELKAGLAGAISNDSDGDGLTNTEESWWCTDPMNQNSDGDAQGYKDGQEVHALLDFTLPRSVRWGYGAPFGPPNAWPDFNNRDGNPATPSCNDGDYDTIPDYAEAYMVGTRVPEESTDHDKFDDGQELFGATFCPGGELSCGYGAYPRVEYWNYIKASMPDWVLPPGDNPFVAAFPVPEVFVTPSSWKVARVTTITTAQGQMTQVEKNYQTTATRGQSTSVADTVMWNNWEEVSEAVETPLSPGAPAAEPKSPALAVLPLILIGIATGGGIAATVGAGASAISAATDVIQTQHMLNDHTGEDTVQELIKMNKHSADLVEGVRTTNDRLAAVNATLDDGFQGVQDSLNIGFEGVEGALNNGLATMAGSLDGVHYAIDQQGKLLARGLYDISYQLSRPRLTETRTDGRSWGGSQTTSQEVYEEHSIAEGEAFTSGENWSTAWAVDSSHAGDLTFDFTIKNSGTEYAREVAGVVVNIYIGDEKQPSISYPAWETFPGGKIENLFPGNTRTFASSAIHLSLDQMRRIDLGEQLKVVVENYSFGSDELFYNAAISGGLTVYIEDGTEDGNESVDSYVIPTWGTESVLDVLTRYFPAGYDADGNVNALWTAEFNGTNPPLWHEFFLSDIAWWNVYSTQADVGTSGLKDVLAQPGSAMLFRFNRDSDRDGYNDRAEFRYYCALPSTHPDRLHCADAHLHPEVHPQPELLAGYVADRAGNTVTAKLVVENTGTFDAYGIDAVMYAPDDSVTIENNTVGGNGRARPGQHVAVGSLVKPPVLTAWTSSTAKPYSGGSYTGAISRTYVFTTSVPGLAGQGTTALAWSDGAGDSGTLPVGAGYHAPLPLDVSQGLQIGLNTGSLVANERFTVQAFAPLDTFTYTINSEPYTPPVIVVSYSEPQGNHRFVADAPLASLDTPLSPCANDMLRGLELSIVTHGLVSPVGPNTTSFVFNSPHGSTISNTHLYLDFVSDGHVVAELPYTFTLPTGPTVVPVTWSTDVFSVPYNLNADNILIAFWTDAQNNIIDSAARPLSSFQDDPRPAFETDEAGLTWDFGTAQQGTLMQRQFALASVGYMDLLTYIGSAEGITLDVPANAPVGATDMAIYTMTVNTEYLPTGAFLREIPIRTSDASNPTRTVTVRGMITPGVPDAPGGALVRPLDAPVSVPGGLAAHTWFTYTHNLRPDTQTLQPVKVYSQDYTTMWGMGKYATGFGNGTASYDTFGDGLDGDMFRLGGQTFTFCIDNPCAPIMTNFSVGQRTLSVSNMGSLRPGAELLIIQSQGGGAGNYEFVRLESSTTDTITLTKGLAYSYAYGGNTRAQVVSTPNWRSVELRTGATIGTKAWDGSTGGIVAFRSANGLVVQPGASIDVSGKGFRGGRAGNDDNNTQGEGYTGIGLHDGMPNGNGGGGGHADTGGGGGYGADGSPGTQNGNVSGRGGLAVGTPDLASIFFGGGGGGGGSNGCGGGNGAAGGGVVLIYAQTIQNDGTIRSVGASAADACERPGGGGSGGTIKITGREVALGSDTVTANGGTRGGPNGSNCPSCFGGNGAVGRIRVEAQDSTGRTSPAASVGQAYFYVAEQVESSPYNQGRLNLPEDSGSGKNYHVQYGRRYVFAGAGSSVQSIRLPKQIFATSSLDVLVSNTGASSGALNLSLDIGDNASTDWSSGGGVVSFPYSRTVTSTVAALNAYLVSRSDVAWGADIDVPVRATIDRQADVILTNLILGLQSNQLSGAPGLLALETGADRPLDWTTVITGSHSQGETITFTHTLGPDAASLQPCKVYDQSGQTMKGVGKYCADFGQGTASADMFGDGRDGLRTIASNTTDTPQDSPATGAAGAYSLAVSNQVFTVGQAILIHQTRGGNAGAWMVNKVLDSSGGTITLARPLNANYTSGAQAIVLKQYTNVTVNAGVEWTAKAWNGSTGGILGFLANGTVTVNGTLSASYKGYNSWGHGDYSGFGGPEYGEGYSGARTRTGPPALPVDSGGATFSDGGGHTSGAGGGNASNGGNGTWGDRGGWSSYGGLPAGTADLATMVFGGQGGGGSYTYGAHGGDGGDGGGLVFVASTSLSLNGGIVSNGEKGGDGNYINGNATPAGGGAGGPILLKAKIADIGSLRVAALGGAGGTRGPGEPVTAGAGAAGRIRVEYCDSMSGTTNPPASMQKLDCYIAEQTGNPSQTKLTLPDTFANGATYITQFGRRFSFAGTGQQLSSLHLTRQMYGTASLDALVSNTGVSSGNLTLCLDIGADGSCDYPYNQSTTFPATLPTTNLATALNSYMQAHNEVAWGSAIDVPVRVQIDRAGDVMLTNLALTPSGAKTRFVRLQAQQYQTTTVSLRFEQGGVISGPLAFTVDVGADGTVDWTYAGNQAFPAIIQSPNVFTAVNAYVGSRTGQVDVPLRIIPSPFMTTTVAGMRAVPTAKPDLSLSAPDVTFTPANPVEGDVVTVTATLHNGGGRVSGGVVASFLASLPGWGMSYVGADFAPNVANGGTAQAHILWNTLGFTGSVPLRVTVDPTNRVGETIESNNVVTVTLPILTRPDLRGSFMLSDSEPVVGEAVTVTVLLSNTGQTNAGSSSLGLYDGNPDSGGSLLSAAAEAVWGGGQKVVSFVWTPATTGNHRLFLRADKERVVNESDEGNNDAWRDVYVGFRGPILLDSGGGSDPAYSPSLGYGYVTTSTDAITCGSLPTQTLRASLNNRLEYRFDHLQPGHFYHLDMTFFECDGSGRVQSVFVDGENLVAGPVAVPGAPPVRHLSLRLDPALYADRSVSVVISETQGYDAQVAEIALYDVDYRYADAGGGGDVQYPGPLGVLGRAYGWLDGVSFTTWGTLPYQSRRSDTADSDPSDDPDSELRYRFDGLNPAKQYRLQMSFYHQFGTLPDQFVAVDGTVVVPPTTLPASVTTVFSPTVPLAAYGADGSIIVSITRTNATANAFINEIALEEITVDGPNLANAFSIPLFVGWNLISSPLEPLSTSVTETLSSISGAYDLVYAYKASDSVDPWKKYDIAQPSFLNDLTVITESMGLWLHVTSPTILVVTGTIPLSPSIALATGWNLVGYPSLTARPVTVSLQTCGDKFDLVYTYVASDSVDPWKKYDTAQPPFLNDLVNFEPGRGYWIHATQPCVWILP